MTLKQQGNPKRLGMRFGKEACYTGPFKSSEDEKSYLHSPWHLVPKSVVDTRGGEGGRKPPPNNIN